MLVETPTQPLSSKDIEILAGHLQVLCARYPVSLGYLYGSQVRGTAHALSDVDVGFLLDNMDRKAYREMWVDLYDAVSRFCPDHEVDLVILNLVGPLLRNKVIREIDHDQIHAFLTRRLGDFQTYARHIVAYIETDTDAGASPASS